jgi:hypothetical protein
LLRAVFYFEAYRLTTTGTIASVVAFAVNFQGSSNSEASTVSCPKALYITFIITMASAILVASFGIVSPSAVCRPDGSKIRHYEHKGWLSELKAQRETMRDWKILSLTIPLLGAEVAIIVFSTLNCKSSTSSTHWSTCR